MAALLVLGLAGCDTFAGLSNLVSLEAPPLGGDIDVAAASPSPPAPPPAPPPPLQQQPRAPVAVAPAPTPAPAFVAPQPAPQPRPVARTGFVAAPAGRPGATSVDVLLGSTIAPGAPFVPPQPITLAPATPRDDTAGVSRMLAEPYPLDLSRPQPAPLVPAR